MTPVFVCVFLNFKTFSFKFSDNILGTIKLIYNMKYEFSSHCFFFFFFVIETFMCFSYVSDMCFTTKTKTPFFLFSTQILLKKYFKIPFIVILTSIKKYIYIIIKKKLHEKKKSFREKLLPKKKIFWLNRTFFFLFSKRLNLYILSQGETTVITLVCI